jgi:tagatose-6-phosphate ketose/aldose isomerase
MTRLPGSEPADPLSALLHLSEPEKRERGLSWTPQEIAQQPQSWRDTFALLSGRQTLIQDFLRRAGILGAPDQRPTVFLIGAGTSDYIGHCLHLLLRKLWECEVFPVASTSLLTDFASYALPGRRYLWISFSRSGDSPEGVAVLERALAGSPNIAHLVVTCNSSGRMLRLVEGRADSLALVLDEKVNDRGLAMTGSFTNMVVAGQMLAHAWRLAEYLPILNALANAAEKLLPQASSLAAEIAASHHHRACFIGSGALTGAAMESALKTLELTAGRVQTMSQSALGLRHGPMAALDPEALLVAFISSQQQRRSFELDLLREIGSKGLVRTRIAVATQPGSLSDHAEHVLCPDESAIPDACRPPLDVIFGQLLGLFASIHCGLKPDDPSPSGAISRVVPAIRIY